MGTAVVGQGAVVKNSKNTRRELQKSLDKHRQEKNNDRGDKTHALIIARGGLIF